MTVPRQLIWRVWLPVTLFALWELGGRTGVLDPLFFPPPSALASAAQALYQTGELTGHLGATLSRTLAGFVLGAIAGLACGLAMGLSTPIRRSLEPLVSTFVSSPKLSLLPLLMLVLGFGEKPRLTLVAAAAFIVTALHTLDAVRALNPDFVELARNYGARSWRLVRSVYLPAGLPQLFTGLRLALGRALAVSISVEIVGAPNGIGQMIWSGWQIFATERVYLGVLLAAILGASFHGSMRLLEKAAIPWRD